MPREPVISPRVCAGFTLIELIAVLVLVGIVSAVITPVFGTIDRLRDQALAREVARRLERARSFAMASGDPCGLQFDIANQRLDVWTILTTGAMPTLLADATGSAPTANDGEIASWMPGASVISADIGGTAADTLWFDYEGTPHTRQANGTFIANMPANATIQCSGGLTITVHRSTGLIER